MITHIVLWKLKDRSIENAERLKDLLLTMKGKIPGMLDLEAGIDFGREPRSFDVALITRHASRAALDAYQLHPVHEQVKAVVLEAREVSTCVDFDDGRPS